MSFMWLVYQIIYIAIFVTSLFALIEALRTPAPAYEAMDKQTKKLWVILLGVGTLISLLAVVSGSGMLTFLALIAALVFIVDVRPAVRGAGRSDGPYGRW
ncbi:DUF2516 family protein [Nocardiopsis trehalosi]|jgi:hypothetical protein|uniref:DUF2516 family protein n=1 Tax=Nocardiopsis trehalosi TaxID=109329 RepID=UPI000A0520C8|nr:DUF2516 family protein [Nocardiopsis trehalosi]